MQWHPVRNKAMKLIPTMALLLIPLLSQAQQITVETIDFASGIHQRYDVSATRQANGNLRFEMADSTVPENRLESEFRVCHGKTPGEGLFSLAAEPHKQGSGAFPGKLISFAEERNLRVDVKPLTENRQLMLFRDNSALLVLDPTFTLNGSAPCSS